MHAPRKFFAVEVVQSSNLDCGPAALKCLLESFAIPVHYGRLREACQTGLDGTSIDTMEVVARQLGLDAEQVMIPPDHLLLPEANALPALVVAQLPGGMTHFVVVWRRLGRLLQVMDPSVGRRWVDSHRFLRDVYRHRMLVPAEGWREFAGSAEFQAALTRRLQDSGITQALSARLLQLANQDASWHSLANLDAATRFLQVLIESSTCRKNSERAAVLEQACQHPHLIPPQYWSVVSGPLDGEGAEQVLVTGAVLVRVLGKRAPAQQPDAVLSPELLAAQQQCRVSTSRPILDFLFESGGIHAWAALFALLAAGAGVLIEALLFRSLFDITSQLSLRGQRLGAVAAILLFSCLLLLFDFALFSVCTRFGRQLEIRLRTALLSKLPRLSERYFQSRLTSDMAERSHALHRIRHLPDLVRQLLVSIAKLLAMATGLVWLQPPAWPILILILAAALLPPLLSQALVAERDLRIRSHSAGLTRFYLDAMLGLLPIRAHNGAPSILREQEHMLGAWAQATLSLQKLAAGLEALQLVAMFGGVALLLLSQAFHSSDIGRVLLTIYWALNLPALGQEIGSLARQYPGYRNLIARVLEPLGAPEEQPSAVRPDETSAAPTIEFRAVSAEASGHAILAGIDLHIPAGAHVAIVGPSGAGKSSLAGLLLGWLKPCAGEILIDGRPADPKSLRRQTALVDPSVQLWNRSLLDNILYGSDLGTTSAAQCIEASALRTLLETLPEGLQTPLGESGALVSGGEGQRVRFARALLRPDVRLVILDEPFRGLDREKRHNLLHQARQLWRDCTLLCITHDITETENFDQVVVMENASIAEQGTPRDLRHDTSSRYAQLLAAEQHARLRLWSTGRWRRIRVEDGRAVESRQAVDAAEVA